MISPFFTQQLEWGKIVCLIFLQKTYNRRFGDRPLFHSGIYNIKYFISTLRVLITNPKIESGSVPLQTKKGNKTILSPLLIIFSTNLPKSFLVQFSLFFELPFLHRSKKVISMFPCRYILKYTVFLFEYVLNHFPNRPF